MQRTNVTSQKEFIAKMEERGKNMAKNNYPQAGLDDIEPQAVQQLVASLRELHAQGKPATDEKVKERIDEYFSFCERSSLRPGIESLCLALHITRTTLYRWANGQDCSIYRQELVQSAKGFIGAFIEQTMLSGKISPPSGIFLMKNWLGYKDAISIEESIPKTEDTGRRITLEELDAEAIRLCMQEHDFKN